jgi:hypothetical protein
MSISRRSLGNLPFQGAVGPSFRLYRADTQELSRDYIFVILGAAKNLSFNAAEIRNEAALRSE